MKRLKINLLFTGFLIVFLISPVQSYVHKSGDKVYIVDQTGTRWDVTQAKTLGFNPRNFQYGIGKNAFKPLDDSNFQNKSDMSNPNKRVIGIRSGDESQAYSVDTLRYHEIANTHIKDTPIAAGY